MKLQRGDIVVHTQGEPPTSNMLFYVEGDFAPGTSEPRLAQVSAVMGWELYLPESELLVVGHSDHPFRRIGSAFVVEELQHFQPAIDEAKRQGYPTVGLYLRLP